MWPHLVNAVSSNTRCCRRAVITLRPECDRFRPCNQNPAVESLSCDAGTQRLDTGYSAPENEATRPRRKPAETAPCLHAPGPIKCPTVGNCWIRLTLMLPASRVTRQWARVTSRALSDRQDRFLRTDPWLGHVICTKSMTKQARIVRLGRTTTWGSRFLRQRFSELGQRIVAAPQTPHPETWSSSAITLAWLGHATVLINFYGVRILTDPVLFRRIGVQVGLGTLGPLRLVGCALPSASLPELDLVLVTHAHFDHLDRPSLRSLRGRPAAVMAYGTADLLPRRRYRSISELRWNEATRVPTSRGTVHVRAVEVQHWGARVGRDTWRGYAGFLLERESRRLLIAGDTAMTPVFRAHRRFGPFDAAVMPIGAYDPWIWAHCTPEEAVSMADDAGVRLIVPVHHQSFRLSREPFHEPIERFQQALAREPERLALSEIGQTALIEP